MRKKLLSPSRIRSLRCDGRYRSITVFRQRGPLRFHSQQEFPARVECISPAFEIRESHTALNGWGTGESTEESRFKPDFIRLLHSVSFSTTTSVPDESSEKLTNARYSHSRWDTVFWPTRHHNYTVHARVFSVLRDRHVKSVPAARITRDDRISIFASIRRIYNIYIYI